MVISSKSPGTPTNRTGRRILGACFRGPQRGCMDWRDRSAFGMADLRRVVRTAEGLTCQPKIAAAGSVTPRDGHQGGWTRKTPRYAFRGATIALQMATPSRGG